MQQEVPEAGKSSNEQLSSASHSYNLRSRNNSRKEPFGVRAEQPLANAIKTGQITSYFSVRKRRKNEDAICSAAEKRGKLSDDSIIVVPGYCSSDDKENSSPFETDSTQVVPEVILDTPLGIFQRLSVELRWVLYDHIPVPQLGNLSLLSTALNIEIHNYILTCDARQRFAVETAEYVDDSGDPTEDNPFHTWGVLLRVCTVTMNFQSRIAFLSAFFCKNNSITDWHGWGHCFMAFCKKWTRNECKELLQAVMQFSGLNDFLSRVMSEEAGRHPDIEMQVRRRIQGFFLNPYVNDESEHGFWISIILRTQNNAALRGQLLMIIFGPLRIDEDGYMIVDWNMLSDISIEERALCEEMIGPLSHNLNLLANPGENLKEYAWSERQVFDLIEDISTSPTAWTLDNFASLLALRPQLIYIALHSRLIHGHHDEAALVFHAVKTALYRWHIIASVAVSGVLLRTFQSLNEFRRRLFLSSLLRTEAEMLSELLLTEPFDRDSFNAELAVASSMSPLMSMLAANL